MMSCFEKKTQVRLFFQAASVLLVTESEEFLCQQLKQNTNADPVERLNTEYNSAGQREINGKSKAFLCHFNLVLTFEVNGPQKEISCCFIGYAEHCNECYNGST